MGAVAYRDLYTYYSLLQAELADAAAQLNRGQVLMILDAVWGLYTDFQWIQNAPELLAGEIEDAYADDEDGPDANRQQLADAGRAWPRLRALAVLEACRAVRGREDESDLDAALTDVGLLAEPRKAR